MITYINRIRKWFKMHLTVLLWRFKYKRKDAKPDIFIYEDDD
tara:strand:- start:6869 stop:6994 length:126 start_codon:yes stop_codon:yes gene_type:complete